MSVTESAASQMFAAESEVSHNDHDRVRCQ